MKQIRRAADRGYAHHGWLEARHTFSFANYYDPKFMGFRGLRVLNEDRVAAGKGFGMHPHRDMEIVTYLLEGELVHKDSMGNEAVLRPGIVQYMRAGSGVVHSEFNASKTSELHLLQIWISPKKLSLAPHYEERELAASIGSLRLIASPDGREGSIAINSDDALWAGKIAAGQSGSVSTNYPYGWLQVARGQLSIGDETIHAGDGVAISDENGVDMHATSDAEVLFFGLM